MKHSEIENNSGRITRISYNSSDWQRPTGDAGKYEAAGTYNRKHGFGHEDWLFRLEWLINGWRYAFIEGVNKSHKKLVKAGQPIDLTLFTIEPDKKRRYVARIQGVECLDDQQAEDALKVFKQRGWLGKMQKEILAVSGDASALGNAKWAKHVLNVRFRLENVTPYPPAEYAAADDPVQQFTRYMLYKEASDGRPTKRAAKQMPAGSSVLPIPKSFMRRATSAVDCTPEHARMQAKLMQELKAEYPQGQVRREQGFIDVIVCTNTELLLFEIKSDLEPRTVIRRALGQILEYAFYPTRQHPFPPRLVIVGRRGPSPQDLNYLSRLQKEFSLPIAYRVVSI